MRPNGLPPALTSKNTFGFAILVFVVVANVNDCVYSFETGFNSEIRSFVGCLLAKPTIEVNINRW